MLFSVQWVFGEMGRKMEAYVVTACGLMAMSCLAFVSIERYLRYVVTSKVVFLVGCFTVTVQVCFKEKHKSVLVGGPPFL